MPSYHWLVVRSFLRIQRMLCCVVVFFCSVYEAEADEMVCGKLNGHVIEFSRDYSMFWPEYEGKSSWEKGFMNNKQGCDASLTSVSIVMTWPQMMPADRVTFFTQALQFEGVSIQLKPRSRSEVNFRPLLEHFLSFTPPSWKEQVRFDHALGLFYVEGKNSVFSEYINKYYWSEVGGKIPVVIECKWLSQVGRLDTCEATYALNQIEAVVDMRFTPEKIDQWESMIHAVEKFVSSKLKQ
ncbi:hypothetical protein [Pseudomonas mandelii]|uniref:hypothetical protein n=1 Tax=Pseudomonas mandelii TaxID=75612 RepID=UPI00224B6425|nr:hypothetical protein [Pseudomonas mandelii]MCX2898530.1 hypothetical protein [Pseudomonas mandelii]